MEETAGEDSGVELLQLFPSEGMFLKYDSEVVGKRP